MMAKRIRALKWHYPKIQFLVVVNHSSPCVTTPVTLTMSEPESNDLHILSSCNNDNNFFFYAELLSPACSM